MLQSVKLPSLREPNRLAVLALLLWIVGYGLFGERVAVNGRLGWDGIARFTLERNTVGLLLAALAAWFCRAPPAG